MPSPQYNPRRQHKPAEKKRKRSGASPSDGGSVQVPWWLWLAGGVAVGVFVSFLMKLAHAPQPTQSLAGTQQPLVQKIPDKKLQPASDATKSDNRTPDKSAPDDVKQVTKFDFYTLLPEREVIVPNDREAIKAADKQKPQSEQVAAAASTPEQLLLQAGSFRSAQEAERRRAQVAALNLAAKVESVQANSDTWYRVQVGPFTSREQLSKARDQLGAVGIESLLLKQKP